ncbi:MAG: hypothetical protein M1834_006306 [Cirrosporium novae-zelandiae]|nr:MAG: hypothetical protein M1834_006306 [Cirrosporium novae-zelandiae]
MPGPANTLLIEGSFEELADELAVYIDNVQKSNNEEAPSVQNDVRPSLEANQKDEALKKLVTASTVLSTAPEKEFIAAYNLLVHLVRQSPSADNYLPRICKNLSSPIPSSPLNGPGLALSILATIFNNLPPESETRFHVFSAILTLLKDTANYDLLIPYLKNIDGWLAAWQTDEEDQRKLFLQIAETADAASESQESYKYLLKALRTFTADEVSSKDARGLAVRALTAALNAPSHFDFTDLTALDAIQSLRQSDSVLFELLELFATETLVDYNSFKDDHQDFVSSHGLNEAALERKMRLLTLASLAASTQSRSLPYDHITRELQIPASEVEMWVIDVIRAGLVEGKLSQMNQTFLIHRATYRVFGEKQWQEVQGRLGIWRDSLQGVLKLIRSEREKMMREKERETREIEGKLGGAGSGGRRVNREMDMGLE